MINTGSKKSTEDICPICKGTGRFAMPKKIDIDSAEIKERLALELIGKGYSYRQVQNALGYKSVRSISHIVEKSKK